MAYMRGWRRYVLTEHDGDKVDEVAIVILPRFLVHTSMYIYLVLRMLLWPAVKLWDWLTY